jgi:hypothetical protein
MFLRFALGFCVSAAAATIAHADILECKLAAGSRSGGYVTELYYFEMDESSGDAQVYDALIEHYEGGPVAAKVSEDTNKKRVFAWTVGISNSAGQVTQMRYRAAYFKGDKTVLITATPGGSYDGNFEARGKCKPAK